MPVTEATYERLALEDPEGQWEYVCGRVRRKPSMTQEHNDIQWFLAFLLQGQLARSAFHVRSNAGRTSRTDASYFIPDVMVVPVADMQALRGTGALEAFESPLPFVAEVWSPSTGDYDVEDKFPEYRRRGDLEIWRIHPFERTVTAWRRGDDGTYSEQIFRGGTLTIASLPGVTIDFEQIFAFP